MAPSKFSVDTPYATPTWPEVEEEHVERALQMFCKLISPIGKHRELHVQPSKGRREKKRKRAALRAEQSSISSAAPTTVPAVPVSPKIMDHITIGHNATVRHLEALAASVKPSMHITVEDPQAQKDSPPIASQQPATDGTMHLSKQSPHEVQAAPSTTKLPHLAVVILPRRHTDPSIQHFPILTTIASIAHPSRPSTLILLVPPHHEERLALSLGVPRISCLGLLDSSPAVITGSGERSIPGTLSTSALPNGNELLAFLDYVRTVVPEIKVGWVEEYLRSQPKYREARIKALEVLRTSIQRSRPEQG